MHPPHDGSAQHGVKNRLLEQFPSVWIEGEVSNLKIPASGHWYFTLKDAQAEVQCVCFRSAHQGSDRPVHGMQVSIRAQVTLYEVRGTYQLMVSRLEACGDGARRRAFEALKAELQAKGWFAPEHKREVPKWPNVIGVVTSPTGAAIRDVCHVLHRRFPLASVIIYPCAVQGAHAPGEIVEALARAEVREECDVLLVVRGGGSLEDLWAFNEREVADAVFHVHCQSLLVWGMK